MLRILWLTARKARRVYLCATGRHWCSQMDSSCHYCGLRAERNGNPAVVLPAHARNWRHIWEGLRNWR